MKKFKAGDLKVTIAEKLDDGMAVLLRVAVLATEQMGVDRSDVAAWSFHAKQRPLAERLKKCIEDGKAFLGYLIETDEDGHTYIAQENAAFFHGRHMNVELKKLGY